MLLRKYRPLRKHQVRTYDQIVLMLEKEEFPNNNKIFVNPHNFTLKQLFVTECTRFSLFHEIGSARKQVHQIE